MPEKKDMAVTFITFAQDTVEDIKDFIKQSMNILGVRDLNKVKKAKSLLDEVAKNLKSRHKISKHDLLAISNPPDEDEEEPEEEEEEDEEEEEEDDDDDEDEDDDDDEDESLEDVLEEE